MEILDVALGAVIFNTVVNTIIGVIVVGAFLLMIYLAFSRRD